MGDFVPRKRVLALSCAALAFATLLAIPAQAFAADASFSSKKPAANSTVTTVTPKVSVYIVDRYGLKGSSNMRLYVDGIRRYPKITYKSRYRKVTLTYRPSTPLATGRHKLYVKVKNVRGHWSRVTWYFTVPDLSPPPVALDPMPITISQLECGECHTGYPGAHPMSNCGLCHGIGKPVSGASYSSSSASAHTLSCSTLALCHGGVGVAFPHVLGECARCHEGSYPGITTGHNTDSEAPHLSSSAWCTKSGCHDPSLTVEHYRWTLAGTKLSCATCHASASARVIATVRAGGTACEGCHDLSTAHTASAGSHTLAAVPSCVTSSCHTGGTNVATIHAPLGGCTDCHGSGRTPSLVCSTCHVSDGHPSHAASFTATPIRIGGLDFGVHACSECHPSSDLQTVHGGSASCAKCHPGPADSAKPWLGGCVQGTCHATGALAMHASLDGAHALASTPTCTAGGCHSGGRNVASIHASTAGCAACHAPGIAPTLTCATVGCHPTAATTAAHAAHPATVTSGTVSILGTSYGKHLCSECHATTELQSLHGGSAGCVKCHPSPRNTFAGWAGGCVQGGCHAAVTPLAQHGSIDSAHTSTAAVGCTVEGCHSGGTSIAAIHAAIAGRTDSGCGVCHTKTGSPTGACDTSGCHPATTSASHASHPSAITSGTISINGTSYGKHLCSECHVTTELQAVHGGATSCTKCHPSPRSSFTTWNRACTQGECHKTGTPLALHGGINAAHTTSAAAACTVAGCHSGGSDVAVIHAAVGGCTVCHAPGATLTVACGTAGCHPATTNASHSSHPASVTSATISVLGASYGKHLCSECHPTTELQAVHGGATSCAKCHPAPRNSFTTWSGGCVQGTCHKAGTTLAMHGSIDTSHTAPAGSCVKSGCHLSNVVALHAPGPGCAACHGAGKTLTLTCGTAGCHTSDPHPAHTSSVSSMTITIGGTSFGSHLCAECHASNDLRDLHGGTTGCSTCHPSPRNTFTKWNTTCVQGGCHVPASSASLHGGIEVAHAAPIGSCVKTGCHVSNVATLHAQGPGCAACHATGKTLTIVCATAGCHPTGASSLHSSHPARITSATITINGSNYGNHLCAECHGTTELQAVHGGATSCVTCHPTPRDSFAAWTGGCVQGACHKAGTTLAMHGVVNSAHIATAAAPCTVSGCHSGGTDIAKIHANGAGCATCHVVGKRATFVCATAGCHPNGASPIHTSHPATVTSSTITINGIKYGKHLCSECHASNDLQVLHGGATGCGNCHPTPRDTVGTWTGGCTQGMCHSVTSGRYAHANLNAGHIAATAPSCTVSGCHAGGSDVAQIHSLKGGCTACHGVGRTPTLVCGTCHAGDVNAIHASYIGTKHDIALGSCVTASCHVDANAALLHAPGNGCVDCHATGVTASLTCANCHPGTATTVHAAAIGTKHTVARPTCQAPVCHGSDAADLHPRTGCSACHAPAKTASLSCPACHAADVVTLHPTGTAGHTVNQHPCTTSNCHGSNAATAHAYSIKTCMACHTEADGTADSNACYGTYGCHDLAWASRHATAAQVTDFHGGGVGNGDSDWGWWSEGWILPPYTRGISLPCSTCHDIQEVDNIHNLKTTINGRSTTARNGYELGNVCIACHGGTVNQWHAGCIACHDGGMGSGAITDFAGQDCSRCHQHGMQGWPHSIWSFQGATM